ncbi:RNA-directed DNA polymerase from mobile element jockey-like, partial [Brachionus plicatilis]
KGLEKLGLTTLSKRRERGDLVEYFKIVNGLTQVNWHNPNKLCDSLSCSGPAGSIRGYQHRMSKQLTRINQREHFILNRVVDNWNKLPPEVVKASSKNLFKKMVDEIVYVAIVRGIFRKSYYSVPYMGFRLVGQTTSDMAKISPNISKIKSISTIAHFQCIFKINIPIIIELSEKTSKITANNLTII